MPEFLKQHAERLDYRLVAIAMSVLFSLVVIASSPILNDDAFSYLKAAELFSDQGLDATLSAYGWYGYSILIALIDSVLPLGLINSAHLLNIFSFALLVYAFITLVMEYRNTAEVKAFAALVILCLPTINEMRYYLIRDFAYWGFCLVALVQLIRFNKQGGLIHATGWLLAMAAAIFFRLEGLIILVFSPIALLIPFNDTENPGGAKFFRILLLLAGGILGTTMLFLLAGINLFEVFNFAYRWYLPLLSNYPDTIAGAAQNTNVSTHISEQLELFSGKGLLILIIGYLYSVIASIVMALGPVFSLILVYGFISGRQALASENQWPWLLFLGSSILSLLIFVSIMQFLTSRYAVMSALLLLSLLPLSLESLYLQAREANKLKRYTTVVTAFILFFTVDSLISFGYSKSYIVDAIDWSGDTLVEGSTIVTNNFSIAFFSGAIEEYDRINPDPGETLGTIAGQQYLFLDVDNDDQQTLELLQNQTGLSEITRFTNPRNDAVIIFEINTSP